MRRHSREMVLAKCQKRKRVICASVSLKKISRVKSSYRSEETDTAQAFEFFDAARSTTPRRMILPRGVGIQILSAWIQMTGAVSDDVQVIVLRYEFVAAGHHGFMDPSTLTSLGFYDEAD